MSIEDPDDLFLHELRDVYGGATYSEILGLDDDAELLEETLAEKNETDEKLTELASQINFAAETAGGD